MGEREIRVLIEEEEKRGKRGLGLEEGGRKGRRKKRRSKD